MPLPLRPITDDDSQSTVVESGRRPSPQRPALRASVITGGGQPLSPGSVALPTDVAVVGQVRASPFLPTLSPRSLPGSTSPPRRSLPQVKPITRPSFSRPTRASFQQHHANRPSILASAAHVAQAAQAVLSVVGNQPAPPKEPSIRGGVRPSPLTREASGQQGGARAGRGASFKVPAESAGAGGRVVGPPPMVRGASGRPAGSFHAAAAPSGGGGGSGGQSDAAAADGAPAAAAAAAGAAAGAVCDAAVAGKQPTRASFGARRADKPLAEPPQRRPSYLNKVPPAASERPTGAPSLVGAGAVPTGAGEKPEPARRPSFNRGRRVG